MFSCCSLLLWRWVQLPFGLGWCPVCHRLLMPWWTMQAFWCLSWTLIELLCCTFYLCQGDGSVFCGPCSGVGCVLWFVIHHCIGRSYLLMGRTIGSTLWCEHVQSCIGWFCWTCVYLAFSFSQWVWWSVGCGLSCGIWNIVIRKRVRPDRQVHKSPVGITRGDSAREKGGAALCINL